MALHNIIGKKGEVEARNFLESKGYQIIDINWRSGHKEIDIVAMLDQVYVFVEVKTRTNEVIDPEDLMHALKIDHLIEAVNTYMDAIEEDAQCRIDLMIITIKGNKTNINHIEDAVSP